MTESTDADRCPRCGASYERYRRNPERHRAACDHAHDSAFSGECPMCGESYASFTKHLKRCEGGSE